MTVNTLPLTSISFAMGWTSVVRQPTQKPNRIVDDENKNYSGLLNIKPITAAD